MPSGLRGGGYLLFHFRSIIGVARFNFSVRNGKRWSPRAIATLVSFRVCCSLSAQPTLCKVKKESGSRAPRGAPETAGSNQADGPCLVFVFWGCPPERVRVISIARL